MNLVANNFRTNIRIFSWLIDNPLTMFHQRKKLLTNFPKHSERKIFEH